MKLWDKGININDRIETFTVGKDREFDLELARYDVIGNKAHAKMLQKIGLLTKEELLLLLEGLDEIAASIDQGDFIIEPHIEDVHSQVEHLLTQKLGTIGKKIHAGRSRNDQVLLDLKLFFREEIKSVFDQARSLALLFLDTAQKHKDILLPGYTHLQIAMPSSFGLWFSAYGEALVDDLLMLECCHRIINQNPLGSAAGYGSSFPLDRTMTTEEMNFRALSYNVVYAQMGRGKTELQLSYAIASLAATLSKFAMDVCLYNSQNFGFIKLPDEFTTGSSIMPHKKNPDVFELIRGHANQLTSLPAQISAMTNNLPSGYHREFQLLKEVIFPAIHKIRDCLEMLTYVLPKIEVQKDILSDPKYRYVFSVEVVNKLVMEGWSFRDAYIEVGKNLNRYLEELSHTDLQHTHEGSLGNLCLSEIRNKIEQVTIP